MSGTEGNLTDTDGAAGSLGDKNSSDAEVRTDSMLVDGAAATASASGEAATAVTAAPSSAYPSAPQSSSSFSSASHVFAERLPSARALAVAAGVIVTACFFYLVITGEDTFATVVACLLLLAMLITFIHACLSPDTLRSQYAEQTLSIASDMLADMTEGLTPQSAHAICRRLLPETRAVTIAVTDESNVLACEGDYAADFPPGSPIHTPVTRYVIEHGLVQSFTNARDIRGERGRARGLRAGIVAPLKVRGKAIGTLKFYFRSPRDVNRTQYALVSGFAELLSTQLAIHELDRQSELTARAEVRALQAQINPHFLFNTLNTIAALTRTEPLRARELLREFASFYRATLDNSGSLIPVSREMAQTERYLLFEKARFGEDRIKESVSIEDGVEEFLVPAFIIQPLVENAVRHAMPDDGPLRIDVTVRSEGDRAVLIEVADDGRGMDEQTASRLFKATDKAADTSAPQGGGAGVAMHNISERIKRFYGPKSSAAVASKPGIGTTIVLHLDLDGSMYSEG